MPELIAASTLLCVGAIVWAIRQEGRVNGHDRLFEEREKHHTERHTELQARLARIETKLDHMCGVLSRDQS